MAIWIQSLSWALIYSLGQGLIMYLSLWVILKLLPALSASIKYHLSLAALTGLLLWFAGTWYTQFHALSVAATHYPATYTLSTATIKQQLYQLSNTGYSSSLQSLLSTVKVFMPLLSALYLTGLVLMMLRLSLGMQQLVSLRSKGVSQTDVVFDDILTMLKAKLHYSGSVRLLASVKAQVPMVIGVLKPIILMPAAAMAQLSREQLETIILHELAHIKRHDYLINILQTVVETTLFFNPFIWLVSAITRREREHCCDDLVLDHTRETLLYAGALTALAAQSGYVSVFTVAASGRSSHLFNRIKRIMEMKKNSFSYSRMVAAILSISAIACSALWLTPSFAQQPKKSGDEMKAFVSPAINQEEPEATIADQETGQLIKQLSDDHLISEVKGFSVEKRGNELYIDDKLQPAAVADKYLSTIKQETIWVRVYPFQERLNQHPDATLFQLMAPVSFSSPCVKTATKKKPGC